MTDEWYGDTYYLTRNAEDATHKYSRQIADKIVKEVLLPEFGNKNEPE